MLSHTTIATPIGPLTVVADPRAVVAIRFASESIPDHSVAAETPVLAAAAAQLGEYFVGTRREFDLPLAAAGTEFQRAVWRALTAIPFGVTWGYAELATRVGRPSAARAVGAANGRNPIPIVVPCHRVIGKDGSLTGYAGGMAMKRWLLDHETRRVGD